MTANNIEMQIYGKVACASILLTVGSHLTRIMAHMLHIILWKDLKKSEFIVEILEVLLFSFEGNPDGNAAIVSISVRSLIEAAGVTSRAMIPASSCSCLDCAFSPLNLFLVTYCISHHLAARFRDNFPGSDTAQSFAGVVEK